MRKAPLFTDNLNDLRGGRIPMLGTVTPPGYKRLHVGKTFGHNFGFGTAGNEYLFVDSSGIGGPNEPAMTIDQFAVFIEQHPGYGYGIVEAGQFQVCIGVYQKDEPIAALAGSDDQIEARIIAQRDELADYHALHDELSDMIESGRLTEADIPDDYQWLVDSLANIQRV